MILAAVENPIGIGIGVAAVSATITGAIIAFCSWRVNVEKLRLDLYLRRFALYKSLRKTIDDFYASETLNEVDALILEIEFAKTEAAYLFGDERSYEVDSILESAKHFRSLLKSSRSLYGDLPILGSERAAMNGVVRSMESRTVSFLRNLKQFLDFHDVGIRDDIKWYLVEKWPERARGRWRKMVQAMERARRF